MTRAWDLWGNVIIAAVFAALVGILAILLLARHRTRRGHPAPMRTALADVGIVVGTAPWIWMILTPGSGQEGVSWWPAQDLGWIATESSQTVLVQVGGNLLVFAALGALLPVRSPRWASAARVAAVAATASIVLETLQYVLRLGRYSSVDDVLINTMGAVLAALVTRRWWARRIPGGRRAR